LRLAFFAGEQQLDITATVAIEPALNDVARRTAHWIAGFYRDVIVDDTVGTIVLRSGYHDEAGLLAIWATALANERLLERAGDGRGAALATLAR
jgi:hypothetical protein